MKVPIEDPHLKDVNLRDPSENQASFYAVSNEPLLRCYDVASNEKQWLWSEPFGQHRALPYWNHTGSERVDRIIGAIDGPTPNKRDVVASRIPLSTLVVGHGFLGTDYQGLKGQHLGTGTEPSNGAHYDRAVLVSEAFGHLIRLRFLTALKESSVRPIVRLRISHSQLADRLNDLSDLRPNWDGYGAKAVSVSAIESCACLLNKIEGFIFHTDDPFIAPMANGGLELDWELSGIEIMFVVPPRRTPVEFLASYADGSEREGFVSISTVNTILHSL